MGYSLTYTPSESSGDFECPPKDTYTLELVSNATPERKLAFESTTVYETQIRMGFKIVDFDYDEDEDEKDWNGTEVRDWFTFHKEDTETGRASDVWKSDRSKAFHMLTALNGEPLSPDETFDLDDFIGRRIKATVEPKKSGYPKITNPMKARKAKSAKPKPPAPDDFNVDDDDDL